jgi:hypothetical protein
MNCKNIGGGVEVMILMIGEWGCKNISENRCHVGMRIWRQDCDDVDGGVIWIRR